MKWVVKIGGGLYDSPKLAKVVQRLSDFSAPALVVPGGGPFADQVRAAQKRWGFDDRRAHAMALLAMRQYGYLLAALGELDTHERIELPAASGASQIWLPDENSLSGDLAANWEVTSDSIAAWLAGETGADWLVLIKPLPLVPPNRPLGDLVDAAFATTVKTQASGLRCAVVGVEQWLGGDFSCAVNQVIPD